MPLIARSFGHFALVFLLVSVVAGVVLAAFQFKSSGESAWGPMLVRLPAIPVIQILDKFSLRLSDVIRDLTTAVTYGLLAAVWFLPLRSRFSWFLFVLVGLYAGAAALFALVLTAIVLAAGR